MGARRGGDRRRLRGAGRVLKVLCVSALCPHADTDSAGAADVHHMLRLLARNHEVTVVCPVKETDRPALPSLEEIVDRVVAVEAEPVEHGWRHAALSALSLPTPMPAVAFLNNDRRLRSAIRKLAGSRFDVAHFAFTQTMHLRRLLPPGLPAVIDESDIAFERRQRFARTVENPLTRAAILLDSRKLRRYELRGLASFDAVLLRTRREVELLKRLIPLERALVVPPWVDVSFRAEVAPAPTSDDVLFFAALWRPVNEDAALWLAREVFPLVRARVPESRLLLVGSRPSAAVRALASDAVEVTGYVDSIAPYYDRAGVAVAPLRAGSGIRGKVLQALGVGRPVVATPIGAEGIDASEADGLFVREDPEGIAEAVVSLLTNGNAERRYEAGRRYFDESYRWEEACRAWEALLEELSTRRGA